MDADLFMECEEEELEPWQLVDDDVDEDDDIIFVNDNTCAASQSSPETSHPCASLSISPPAAQCAQATILNASCLSVGGTTTSPVTVSVKPNTMAPVVSSAPMPTGSPLVPAGISPGQNLILTQTPAGLGTILMPAVNPGMNPAINQPIFLTTQGFPVQNVGPAQSTVNPLSFVLNMQQSPGFQPITLLTGPPDGQLFRPALGLSQSQPAQALTQLQSPQVRATSALVQPSTTLTTIKIPASLTFRTNQSGLSSGATVTCTTTTTDTRPSAAPYLTSHTQTVSPSSEQTRVCPRCGSQYKMQAALQGHMCFCCPDLVNSKTNSPAASYDSPKVRPVVCPSPAASENTSSAQSSVGPPKVLMIVDDFYYGSKEGKHRMNSASPRTTTFQCNTCDLTLIDNVGMMSHMWRHSNQVLQTTETRSLKSCHYCFRQFSSPQQWNCHMDKVHGPTECSRICKICEWVFESEPVFLLHMKATHKPGEMPYVCQVCEFSSSFYLQVYNHFLKSHRDTAHLLCFYCLKVNKNQNSYQQHFMRHQRSRAFHCNKCRLQFVFVKDLMEHKTLHHKTCRKPRELEGLPPGAKVTIRVGSTFNKALQANRNPLMPLDTEFPPPFPVIHRTLEPIQDSLKPTTQQRRLSKQAGQTGPVQDSLKPTTQQRRLSNQAGQPGPDQIPSKNKSVSKMLDLLMKFQDEGVGPVDKQRCMECGTMVSSFPDHYPTSVQCLLCPYSTCCSRSYAHHMINNHVPHTDTRSFPRHKRPPPCYFKLRCCGCGFISSTGDLMAKHLAQFPDHGESLCERNDYLSEYQGFDIEFCQSEEQGKPGRNEDLQTPAWASTERWTEPLPSGVDGAIPVTHNFTVSSGPHRSLSKNSDAIDYFNVLFPKELVELIAYETNFHVKTCQFLCQSHLDWVPITVHEIRAFVGLSILMGLQNLPELTHYWSWQHNENCHIFFRTMSISRFQQISQNLCMGSLLANGRSRKSGGDRLAILKPMLGVLGDAMWTAYRPNRCLAIDRALLPSLEDKAGSAKGLPKAPPPQVWLLCDSKSGYCHRFLIQTGTAKGTDLGFSVVLPLVEGLQDKHHQLFLASSLTSVPLMQRLLDQGIYSSSSFPAQSPILPPALWEQGRLDKPGDFLQRQHGPLLATRWMDAKEMGCLSTNAKPGEPDTVWRKSQTRVGELSPIERPQAFRLLQENMRGVDICKQLLACNPLGGLQHDKHWRSLFWFLVNLSIVNAFIVLRESRKDNPPPWVQDGRFAQAMFRRRLGNQLVKSAQRRARVSAEKADAAQRKARVKEEKEEKEEKEASRPEGDVGETSVRHKMVRLTSKTHRCRTCYMKNVRHESVYGCVVCKVNLCKQSSCFWEHHGLPPETPGNIFKVGFLEDTRGRGSRWLPSDEQDDELDMAMAPVEVDTDSAEGEEEETRRRERTTQPPRPPVSPRHAPAAPPAVRDGGDALSAHQLRIALLVLCGGMRQASRDFSTPPRLIRTWLAEKRRRLRRDREGERDEEAAEAGEERVVEWVLAQREQQLPVYEESLFRKASQLHKEGGFSGHFRISYDWAVGLMLRHRLGPGGGVGGRTGGGRMGVGLPRFMEDNVRRFTHFVRKCIEDHKLPRAAVAAMDELSVFVDFKRLADESEAGTGGALQLVGGGEPLLTVYLAVLADGTALPALVLSQEPLPVDVPPPSPAVHLEAKTKHMTREEELDLWVSRIWRRRRRAAAGESPGGKALLILDGHRDHASQRFLDALGAAATLPAVVPAGCSARLQPLEACLRPALQRLLRARWAAEGGLAGASPALVVRLLVGWLAEPLARLAERPDLVRRSFLLTGLLRPEEEEEEETQDPEEARTQLMRTLAEVVLGPGATAPETEDEDGEEDDVQSGGDEDREGDGRPEEDDPAPQPTVEMDKGQMDDSAEEKTDNEDENNIKEVGDKMEDRDDEKTDDEDENNIEEVGDKMEDKDDEKTDDEEEVDEKTDDSDDEENKC